VDDEKYIQQPCENLTIRVKPFILSERKKKTRPDYAAQICLSRIQIGCCSKKTVMHSNLITTID
jgi:hypothetical protein